MCFYQVSNIIIITDYNVKKIYHSNFIAPDLQINNIIIAYIYKALGFLCNELFLLHCSSSLEYQTINVIIKAISV